MATSNELELMLTSIENGETFSGAFEVSANEGKFLIRIFIPKGEDENGEGIWETIEQEIPAQMMQMAKVLGVF